MSTEGLLWDLAGNPAGHISPGGFDTTGARTSGFQTLVWPDGPGRPLWSVINTADGTGPVERYRHNTRGMLTGRLDGRENLFRTTFNPWGQPERIVEPTVDNQQAVWETSYDAGGLPVHETQPGGVDIVRSYTPAGALEHETGTSPNALEPDATRRFGFDRAGRMATAGHPAGDITFVRDGQGRVLRTVNPDGSVAARAGFDPAGRLRWRSNDPDADVRSWFTYNKADQLTRSWRGIPQAPAGDRSVEVRYGYHDDGRLGAIAAQDLQLFEFYSYDGAGRQTSRLLADSDLGTLSEQTIDWGPDGLPSAQTFNLPGETNPAEGTHSYLYDQAGRLTSWTAPDGTATAYSWDDSHNRIQAGDDSYQFDARNRIVSGPTRTAAGAGTSTQAPYLYTPRGTAVLNGADLMLHDPLGRRTFATGMATSYDSLDRPVDITVGTGLLADLAADLTDDASSGCLPLIGCVTDLDVQLLNDTVDLVEDTNLQALLDEAIGDAGEITDGLGLYHFGYNGTSRYPTSDGVSDYYRRPDGTLFGLDPLVGAADGISDPVLAGTNMHGDLAWTLPDAPNQQLDASRIYEPFGVIDGQTGLTSVLSRAGFQGDWTDPVSGQVHMGARWYRPSSATFTARDLWPGELDRPVTRNRYLYANGSPIRMHDPTGRCSEDWLDAGFGFGYLVGACRSLGAAAAWTGGKAVDAAAWTGRQVAGAVGAVGSIIKETVEGSVMLAKGGWDCAWDPGGCAQNVAQFGQFAVNNPGVVWDALTEDVRRDLDDGNYGGVAVRTFGTLLAVSRVRSATSAARSADDMARAGDNIFAGMARHLWRSADDVARRADVDIPPINHLPGIRPSRPIGPPSPTGHTPSSRPSTSISPSTSGHLPSRVDGLSRALVQGRAPRAVSGAGSAAQGARLRTSLRLTQNYGAGGVRQLADGRIRYYDLLDPARKPGPMAGRRLVREWDPATGRMRTWHETLDRHGRVRQVRPVQQPRHYTFDETGNYTGYWPD